MLNCDWLQSGEAVDVAEAGEAGDASLKHSLSIWVTGWFQARFQMRLDDDAPSSSYGASFFGEACGVLLEEGGFPCRDLLEGVGGRVRDPVEAAFRGGRVTVSKAVCLNLSNSLRLSQDRTRAILLAIDPNDSAARADTQGFYHLQAKIHELFIILTDRIDQYPDPNVSNPPPSVPTPPPVKHNLLKISLPKFNGEFSEWENFWGLFSNLIHECAVLGNVIKFHYLLSSFNRRTARIS